MSRFWSTTLCSLTLLGLLASAPAAAQQSAGTLATDFTLRDIENQAVSLADYRGSVVLMNFWATWCGPCMQEMPHLQAMYDELKGQGFVVLSVSTDDARDASKVKPLVKAKRLTFPVVLDKETTVVSQYNPAKTLPYTVLIDRDGKIAKVHQGYNPGDEKNMRTEVLALLAKPSTTAPAGTAAPTK